jgi:hypothetical protein
MGYVLFTEEQVRLHALDRVEPTHVEDSAQSVHEVIEVFSGYPE